jgi:hypothetical protein
MSWILIRKAPFPDLLLPSGWQKLQANPERLFTITVTQYLQYASVRASLIHVQSCCLQMSTIVMYIKMAEFDIPVYEIRPGVETDMIEAVRESHQQ